MTNEKLRLPQNEAPHAPSSRQRLLEEIDGEWYWGGERIEMDKLVH